MKKYLSIVIVLLFIVSVVACNKSVESSVVISKLYGAYSQSNNVVELYNNSSESESLDDYKINVYTNGSKEVTKVVELSGTIEAHSYFVISGSSASNSDVVANSDFEYSEGSLPFNGDDAIELVKEETVIDAIGTIGLDVKFSYQLTLIRLGETEDYMPSADYDAFNFIYYIPEVYEYLKNDNYEIKTLEDLYAGPRLEDRFYELPYIDSENDTIGAGGAVETNVSSVADGDTAYFTGGNGFPGGSMRYYYINTPEVDGSYVNAEPWGYVASKYNKEYLLNDATEKEILVQSIPGISLTETNGRNLGLVWVNGNLSQFLIVSEGLTEDVGTYYGDYDYILTYKQVPYLTFMRFAEERANQNGWGVHGYPSNVDGEKSPDWNYQSNSKTTTNPVWEPHLELPWA